MNKAHEIGDTVYIKALVVGKREEGQLSAPQAIVSMEEAMVVYRQDTHWSKYPTERLPCPCGHEHCLCRKKEVTRYDLKPEADIRRVYSVRLKKSGLVVAGLGDDCITDSPNTTDTRPVRLG